MLTALLGEKFVWHHVSQAGEPQASTQQILYQNYVF